MFDFIIWKMENAGLLVNCLTCQCTWGIQEFDNYLLDELSDDYKVECPVCKKVLTGAEIKVSITRKSDFSVDPDHSLEDYLSSEKE